MELRTRTPLLRRAAMMAALVALAAPATAGAAPNVVKAKDASPVVASVRPLDVAVGDVLTLRGKHFRAGVKKTTVVFKRDGARAVAAKADRSTTTLLWITVPAALKAQMRVRSGQPVSTRFRLRVLGSSFGRRYTALKASPTIVPCEDGDLLGHDLEAAIGTDPCKADTDGDHVADGFEYQSALDLNDDEDQDPNEFLPYPGKRPYPNALDPKDAGKDFDGDSLTLAEEHALWRYTWQTSKTDAHTLTPLSYSDGEQYSRSRRIESGSHAGRRQPWLRPGDRDGQYGRPASELPPTFAEWAATRGYRTVMLSHRTPWDFWGPWFDHDRPPAFWLFDVDRDGYETEVERGASAASCPTTSATPTPTASATTTRPRLHDRAATGRRAIRRRSRSASPTRSATRIVTRTASATPPRTQTRTATASATAPTTRTTTTSRTSWS